METKKTKTKKHAPKQLSHMCERDAEGRMWPDQKMSTLERQFLNCWQECNGPDLERETLFDQESCAEASGGRKWRADFVHRSTMTLIEIEGGAWSGGRHTRGKGFLEDATKYLRAWELGWNVIRLSSGQVNRQDVQRIVSRLRGGEVLEKPDWMA